MTNIDNRLFIVIDQCHFYRGLYVHYNFDLRKKYFCNPQVESVVACLSDTEVHVFRLKLVDSSDDERNMVINKFFLSVFILFGYNQDQPCENFIHIQKNRLISALKPFLNTVKPELTTTSE